MMTYAGVIYAIKNTVTGDYYIGQTRQKTATRWANHRTKLNSKSHHSKKLQVAWDVHGQKSFTFIELFYVLDRQYLNTAEKEVIQWVCPKYNMTSGGSGSKDRVITDEHRKIFSDRLKAKWSDPVWKEKHIQILKDSHKTDAVISQIKNIQRLGPLKRWEGHVKKEKPKALTTQSERTRISWNDPEIRAKRIDSIKRQSKKPESVEKRRLASTGRIMDKLSVEKSAKAKWKPVLCEELGVSFLCMKFAAEFLNVRHTTISEAIKMNRKVFGQYTFVKVV